jgi:hypothetical protein
MMSSETYQRRRGYMGGTGTNAVQNVFDGFAIFCRNSARFASVARELYFHLIATAS